MSYTVIYSTVASDLSSGTKTKVEALAVEIEDNLDWCINVLQSMNSKKTAGKLAQEQVCDCGENIR